MIYQFDELYIRLKHKHFEDTNINQNYAPRVKTNKLLLLKLINY